MIVFVHADEQRAFVIVLVLEAAFTQVPLAFRPGVRSKSLKRTFAGLLSVYVAFSLIDS